MLKKLPLILLVFIFHKSLSQIVNDDAAFFNNRYDKSVLIKNSIEEIKIKMYAANELYSIQTFYFDSAGLLYKQTIADSSEILNAQFDFSYNSFGDLIYREQQDFVLKNHDTTIFYKTYNDSLLVRESSTLTNLVNVYFYDSGKRKIKTISCLNQKNECINKRIINYTYDISNKLIKAEERTFKSDSDTIGVVTSERELAYNKDGKIISDKELKNQDNLIKSNKGSITYIYNENNNIKEIIDSNGSLAKYQYNKNGLVISKELTIDFDGNITRVKDSYIYKFRKR